MIHIPTGPIPAKYAKAASVALGAAAWALSYWKPQLAPMITDIGKWLLPLGITLGAPVAVKVPGQ